MKTYPIPMVPGPVKLPQAVLDVYQTNFGSADLETEFLELYNKTESNLKMITVVHCETPSGTLNPIAEFCRNKIIKMGLSLFPAPDAVPSPTVTAANVPDGVDWPEFNLQLRQQGLVVGGSYGPMAGKVFRLGHMGTQADMELVKHALNVIEIVVEKFD